jgi:hypothetical protein
MAAAYDYAVESSLIIHGGIVEIENWNA